MNQKIEFVDLQRQYKSIKEEIDQAINAIIVKGAFVGGQAVELFETAFARYCGTKYAIGVANGTDALHLALKAMGVGPGDEVITVSHTFIATVAAITMVGARPVFAEIDPDTYCLNPASLEKYINRRTKAIIPVHLYGQPADMDPINDLAKKYNLFVLEDACQAHGAGYKGQRAGSLGHIAAFSFYPGKNLGAYGDGGAITTNDSNLYSVICELRDHGRIGKYEHGIFGFNSRLDGIQAAVLGVKLQHLDRWNARRRQIARRYNELLAGVPDLVTPYEAPHNESVYHLYVVRSASRARLQTALTAAEIAHGIHYPIPVHKQPAWIGKYGVIENSRSQALVEQYADQILSLPMHPDLTDEEVEYVAKVVKEALNLDSATFEVNDNSVALY